MTVYPVPLSMAEDTAEAVPEASELSAAKPTTAEPS